MSVCEWSIELSAADGMFAGDVTAGDLTFGYIRRERDEPLTCFRNTRTPGKPTRAAPAPRLNLLRIPCPRVSPVPAVGLINAGWPICLPLEILLPNPEPRKPEPNPGVAPEELMLMLVGLGGDVPSAAAAAMVVPPGGEKGLKSDCEPRLPPLGTATVEGLG